MTARFLTALPVFNEQDHAGHVLDQVVRYSSDVLVVDDGSTDNTAEVLAGRKDIVVVSHPENRGYGAALRTAFDYASAQQFDILVTIDCDGQHEPQRIPQFVAACRSASDDGTVPDIVSGSRYLESFDGDLSAPEDRRRINVEITARLNQLLGLSLTDAFCGFKAYRIESLDKLNLTEDGYGMPLELWIQSVHRKLHIVELPVPLVYLEEERSFGGELDDAPARMAYYGQVIQRSLDAISFCPGDAERGEICGEKTG